MSASTATVEADVIVIGAGIAGAALGHFLAPHARVVVLERESQPGYHSTGRSVALFMESYGPPQARALTMASRAFFETPPEGFADGPIFSPRGAMAVAGPGQERELDERWEVLCATRSGGHRLGADAACRLVPVLRRERVIGAVVEPDACDIDVARLHQGYLRDIRRGGGRIVTDAEVTALQRQGSDDRWHVDAGARRYAAPVVVDAAGAWCDVVARIAGAAPIGLVPKRRSAFVFAPPPGIGAASWPMFGAIDDAWYIKPDATQLLGSPANADPVAPQDVQPEEIDIATAVQRIEEATTLVARPLRTWAGLRSFVADGELVGGFDPRLPGFFWLAAQGGYGIQTSAAMGEACAALIRGLPLPERIAAFGVDAAMLGPSRFAAALPSGTAQRPAQEA